MARYTGATCRLCRREGKKLFLKGERCYTEKCGVVRRAYVPGQHGQQGGRKKFSEYGLQLRAKQSARRYYGILEGQFRHYYELARKKEGKTGDALLAILESRLDNVVYRLGFANSRAQARQLVVHGHFSVNQKKVDIPSYLTKPGETVAIVEKSKNNPQMKSIVEANASHPVPKWMEVNREGFEGKILSLPEREDIDLEVEETLIVELYSK
ncbi:MAG: 30S ribosomal protein S4 [Oscillospiraceae bacterium]|jgi:small subunit ribosomal protein S4|nr:30S ribosomal protein S4 [Oscillospiraceae bacterium]